MVLLAAPVFNRQAAGAAVQEPAKSFLIRIFDIFND